MDELAPADVAECLKDYRIHMLRPLDEVSDLNEMCGERRRHVDPALLRKPLSYGKIVRCKHSIGLTSYKQRHLDACGDCSLRLKKWKNSSDSRLACGQAALETGSRDESRDGLEMRWMRHAADGFRSHFRECQ